MAIDTCEDQLKINILWIVSTLKSNNFLVIICQFQVVDAVPSIMFEQIWA